MDVLGYVERAVHDTVLLELQRISLHKLCDYSAMHWGDVHFTYSRKRAVVLQVAAWDQPMKSTSRQQSSIVP